MSHSIPNTVGVSIPAKEKIAVANVSDIRMRRMMSKTHPLAKLIGAHVDEGVENRMTYDDVETASGGRISASYTNELRNGKKDPLRISVLKIIGLAKAFGESPAVIFDAAMGHPQTQLRDKSVEQTLIDFSSLSARDREELRYIYNHFHEKVQEKLNRNF